MATRFRLPSAGAPAVSPAFQSYSHTKGDRRQLVTSDASALGNTSYVPDSADHLVAGDSGVVQFVSDPMDGGLVFTSGDVLKFAVQCAEANAADNQALQCWAGIVSEDGGTAVATLRSKVSEGTEMSVNPTLTNRFLSTTLSGSHTTTAGQRLVVEFGWTGTPTAAGGVQGHNGVIRLGSNGAGGDLPENDTDTGTTGNPWIEFVTNITFVAGQPSDRRDGLTEIGRSCAIDQIRELGREGARLFRRHAGLWLPAGPLLRAA